MHKAKGASTSAFPLRKFYTEQVFVLVRNHKHTTSEAFEAVRYIHNIKFECCKYARMRFHCVDDLVVLRSYAP